MTDYARSSCVARYGTASDFSDGLLPGRSWSYDVLTPSLLTGPSQVSAAVAGTTFALDKFTTIKEMFVRNLDSTNFVTITYRTNAVAADAKQKLLAGEWVKVVDVAPATVLTITANTLACECELIIIGT